jgi:exodeoxyribonuclease VII large subunit
VSPTPGPDGGAVYTVARLTAELRGVLGATFGDVWVRGEISQPRTPSSGHVYLTLKDDEAVLPAVIWRSTAARLRVRPAEGLEVLVRGGIDVYPPHGRYQLVVRALEPLGEGALRLAFEQLRARLEAEGLFEAARKRPLPALPRRVALVTSRTGAAVRDMVHVIHRRHPGVHLLLLPVRVQGEGAAGEIAAALGRADRLARADVILVGRGGGSLEDLWAFNEEVVARAIAACRTPVVSAVGHETDVTIADLVADVRAATPSQAGELVVPVRAELLARLDEQRARLGHRMRVRLERAWQRLEALGDRPVLRTPAGLLQRRARSLAHLQARLAARHPAAALARRAETLARLGARLRPPLPRRLRRARERLAQGERGLLRAGGARWDRAGQRLEVLGGRLRALSPLAVLARGYSLTTRAGDDRVLRRAGEARVGDLLRTRLGGGGHVDSRVERVVAGEETS